MVTHKKLVGVSLTLLSLLGASSASAGPIIFFNTFRTVTAGATGASSTSLGRFQEYFVVANPRFVQVGATAFQDSLIEGAFAGGVGEVTSFAPDAQVVGAVSRLFTGFLLDQSRAASLAVDLAAAGGGSSFVSLTNIDTDQDLVQQSVSNDSQTAAFFGILAAGRYELLISADTTGPSSEGQPFSATASFDGGLSLAPVNAAPVPEPASMTLLGVGLAAAGAKRWRQLRGRKA